jgi:hypothetical protein
LIEQEIIGKGYALYQDGIMVAQKEKESKRKQKSKKKRVSRSPKRPDIRALISEE